MPKPGPHRCLPVPATLRVYEHQLGKSAKRGTSQRTSKVPGKHHVLREVPLSKSHTEPLMFVRHWRLPPLGLGLTALLSGAAQGQGNSPSSAWVPVPSSLAHSVEKAGCTWKGLSLHASCCQWSEIILVEDTLQHTLPVVPLCMEWLCISWAHSGGGKTWISNPTLRGHWNYYTKHWAEDVPHYLWQYPLVSWSYESFDKMQENTFSWSPSSLYHLFQIHY